MQIQKIVDPKAAEPERVFRVCHNGNASDPLVPGDVVEYELAATADYPGVSVVDGTAADPLTAGVVIGASLNGGNIAAGKFGLMQVSGYCPLVTTDEGISAGEGLIAAAAVADTGTDGTDGGVWFGVALADDTDTSVAAVLKGCLV